MFDNNKKKMVTLVYLLADNKNHLTRSNSPQVLLCFKNEFSLRVDFESKFESEFDSETSIRMGF